MAPKPFAKVQVTTITGASLVVNLSLDASLADLKGQVEQKLHIPASDQALLLHGAPLVDGDAPWTGGLPLQLALRRQPRSVAIPALLEASCLSDLNSRVWGKTILHFALEACDAVACMEILRLPDFSGVNVGDPEGYTPLHIAADKGLLSACEAIIHRPDFSKALTYDRRGRTALHCAAASGMDSIVKAFLDDLPSEVLNANDDMGKSALHHAIASGQDHTCVALLARSDLECARVAMEDFGVPVGVLSGEPGSRPKSRSIVGEQGPIQEERRPSKGAEGVRGLQSGRRCTALHHAADARMWRSCLEMLKRKEFALHMNALDHAGRTPLHYAAERGLSDVCLDILDSPTFSEINAVDRDRHTAFECAAKKRLGKVCASFASHPGFEVNMCMGVKESTALHLAAEYGLGEVCLALLKREDLTELDAFDTQRRTALHYGALSGLKDFCIALLKLPGFTQPRCRDVHGKTALEGAQGFLAADVWRVVNADPDVQKRQEEQKRAPSKKVSKESTLSKDQSGTSSRKPSAHKKDQPLDPGVPSKRMSMAQQMAQQRMSKDQPLPRMSKDEGGGGEEGGGRRSRGIEKRGSKLVILSESRSSITDAIGRQSTKFEKFATTG